MNGTTPVLVTPMPPLTTLLREQERAVPHSTEIPYGYCHCGCGEKTRISPTTDNRQGWVRGEPRRFVNGHWRRSSPIPFVEQDCGYRTPCHLWQRCLNGDGYGQVGRDRRIIPAHKLYYEEKYGPVPDGMELDHLCRIRRCVNADHLEAVTGAVNAQRGQNTKLTWEKVAAIRAFEKSVPSAEIGRIFGISKSQIVKIRRGASWKAQP